MGISSHDPRSASGSPTFTRASAAAAWWDNLPYFGSWPKPTLVGALVLNGGIQAAGGGALIFFGIRYAEESLVVTGAIVLAVAALAALAVLVSARRRRDVASRVATTVPTEHVVPPKIRR